MIEYLSVGDDLGSFCILGRRSHFDFSCLDDVLCMHLTRDELFSIFFKYHKDKVDFIRRARMLSRSQHNKKNRLKNLQDADRLILALDSSPKVLGSLLLRTGVERPDRSETSGLSGILKAANSLAPQQRQRSTADDWDFEDGSTVRLNPSSNTESLLRTDWKPTNQIHESNPKKIELAAFDNTDETEFYEKRQNKRLQNKSKTIKSKEDKQKQAPSQRKDRVLKVDAAPPLSNRARSLPDSTGRIAIPLNVIMPVEQNKDPEKSMTQQMTVQTPDLINKSSAAQLVSNKTVDAARKDNKSFLSVFKSGALGFWNKMKEVASIPEKYRRFEYRKDLMRKNNLDEQAFEMKKNRITYYQEMIERFEKQSNRTTSRPAQNWQKVRDFCISNDNRSKELEPTKRGGPSRQNSQIKQISKKQKKILALAFIRNLLEQSSEESLNEEEAANVAACHAEKTRRGRPGKHLRQRHFHFF